MEEIFEYHDLCGFWITCTFGLEGSRKVVHLFVSFNFIYVQTTDSLSCNTQIKQTDYAFEAIFVVVSKTIANNLVLVRLLHKRSITRV